MSTRNLPFAAKSLALLVVLILAACGAPEAPDREQEVVVPDSIVHFLINSAAMDFKAHRPPTVIDIRKARIGYITGADSVRLFVLCGEFRSQEEPGKWTDFTTIKTSGYEHYLGRMHYCEDATVVLTDQELTEELRRRLAE